MLHVSKVYELIERIAPSGGRVPFNCKYVKKNGDVVEYKNIICLSSHFRPQTINIQCTDGKVRKLNCSSILEINGIKIYA